MSLFGIRNRFKQVGDESRTGKCGGGMSCEDILEDSRRRSTSSE